MVSDSSYDSCDVGTLVNQTNPAGTGPPAALNSGSSDYGGILSYQPGQRLSYVLSITSTSRRSFLLSASACTCRGEDHPGPNVGVGRGAPELDLIEALVAFSAARCRWTNFRFLAVKFRISTVVDS